MRTFFYVIFKKFSFRFEQNALFKRDKSEREKDLCSYLMVGEEVNSMEQSSSYDEKTVMHQFDRKCKLALKGEIVDYERHLAYLRKHETLFSELSEQEMESLSIFDEYELEKSYFRAGGYDVEVKNALLAEALTALTERKRDIILLSYFVEMNDADIARKLNLVRSTVHVETVVLLSQQKPDDTIEIDLDLDELDATSAELKATYQEIKDYVLKEFDLKVSNLYISQVKRKCGIEVGENYNLPKSENTRVPQCPKEKEDAIKAALKYFAMI